ncbi:methyltransferase [Acidisphaera sp. S103]|uniref:methyltransferase n=1 Tax=Acidisphaera sp. S103 TaxID=1747223 RepID=UPI00131C2198|nr:methyltransferase [Acidisphaera sp. S103]
MTYETNGDPSIALRRLVFGHRVTRLLGLAAELNLADCLHKFQPCDALKLSKVVAAHPVALNRVLRALVTIGVVAEDEFGRFVLTSMGICLRTSVPGSMKSWILSETSGYFQRAWEKLEFAVRTGKVAFNEAHQMSFYSYMEQHPDTARTFNETMADATRLIAKSVVEAYNFEGVDKVVDVGSGLGVLLIGILEANPTLEGILFDTSSVLAAARGRLSGADVVTRCSFVEGDFFSAMRPNGNVYLLSRVIMDHDDEAASAILSNCRNAMAPGGRILVIQPVLPSPGKIADDRTGPDAFMSDINMLVLERGLERTEKQYSDLFRRAGLEVKCVIPTSSGVSIVEGVRRK